MRYVLALICPPLAFLACKKWARAIPAAALFGLAVVTARYGVGALLELFLVMWAFHAVGDEAANREVRAFVKTVEPIPIIRS